VQTFSCRASRRETAVSPSEGDFSTGPRRPLYFLSSLMEGAPHGDSMRPISLKKQGRPALLESAPVRRRGAKRCRRVQNMAWRIVALFCGSGYWA